MCQERHGSWWGSRSGPICGHIRSPGGSCAHLQQQQRAPRGRGGAWHPAGVISVPVTAAAWSPRAPDCWEGSRRAASTSASPEGKGCEVRWSVSFPAGHRTSGVGRDLWRSEIQNPQCQNQTTQKPNNAKKQKVSNIKGTTATVSKEELFPHTAGLARPLISFQQWQEMLPLCLSQPLMGQILPGANQPAQIPTAVMQWEERAGRSSMLPEIETEVWHCHIFLS